MKSWTDLFVAIVSAFQYIFWRTRKPYGMRHFDNLDSLYETARLFWGYDAIVAMAYGECAELAASLVRRDIQRRGNDWAWKNEVIDVIVMREQLTLLWPNAFQDVPGKGYGLTENVLELLSDAMRSLASPVSVSHGQVLVSMNLAIEAAWPELYTKREFHLLKAHKIRKLERKVLKIYRQAAWAETVKLAGIQPRY